MADLCTHCLPRVALIKLTAWLGCVPRRLAMHAPVAVDAIPRHRPPLICGRPGGDDEPVERPPTHRDRRVSPASCAYPTVGRDPCVAVATKHSEEGATKVFIGLRRDKDRRTKDTLGVVGVWGWIVWKVTGVSHRCRPSEAAVGDCGAPKLMPGPVAGRAACLGA